MKKRIAAIIVALAVALFGAGAVLSYAHSADSRAVAGQRVTTVYIATARVPQGTTAQAAASQGLIKQEQVVAKGVPAGAMTSIDPANKNLVALGDIQAGAIVMTKRFGTSLKTKAAVDGIPNGDVAITVTLGVDGSVSPLIKKGSSLVIYDTFNARDPKAGNPLPAPQKLADDQNKTGIRATSVVLSGVQVLMVGSGTASGKNSSSGASNNSVLVTVAVSPKDAVTLVQATQTGSLYAGLLGSGTKINPKATSSDLTVVKN